MGIRGDQGRGVRKGFPFLRSHFGKGPQVVVPRDFRERLSNCQRCQKVREKNLKYFLNGCITKTQKTKTTTTISDLSILVQIHLQELVLGSFYIETFCQRCRQRSVPFLF